MGATAAKPSELSRRDVLLARIERVTELPLLVLAFAMVPLILGPILWDLSPNGEAMVYTFDLFIWAAFAMDLAIKVAIAPRRLAYLRQHWLEVLIVAVPVFRPVRILRLFVFGSRAFLGVRRLVNIDFLLAYGVGLVLLMATFVTTVERGHGGSIKDFPDAIWWAVSTITTVGYGDVTPITPAGRAGAFVLMVGGITFFSAVTANIAAFLVRTDAKEKPAAAAADQAQIEELVREVASLRTEIVRLRSDLGQDRR